MSLEFLNSETIGITVVSLYVFFGIVGLVYNSFIGEEYEEDSDSDSDSEEEYYVIGNYTQTGRLIVKNKSTQTDKFSQLFVKHLPDSESSLNTSESEYETESEYESG